VEVLIEDMIILWHCRSWMILEGSWKGRGGLCWVWELNLEGLGGFATCPGEEKHFGRFCPPVFNVFHLVWSERSLNF